MQITKDYTRKLLLETARTAFLKEGFKAVSMRKIAKKSGVGLSNIYNYYPCKDDLLAEVLNPLLEAMNNLFTEHNKRPENYNIELFFSEDYQRTSMYEIMALITRYREEFNLLFFSVQESRFKNYWEQWIDKSTNMGIEYMKKMKDLHPQLETDISPFFIHFTCSWWINMMKEVVLHKDLSEAEVERFISEYLRFSTGGWEKLMNIKIES